jgi:oligoendopeptidase F
VDRKKIPLSETWKLEDIFASDGEWEKAFEELKACAALCLKYKGKLNSAENILNCLNESKKQYIMSERLYAYARLKHDLNTKDAHSKGLRDRIANLLVTVSSNNSFIIPEIGKLSNKLLKSLASDKRFEEYDYFLTRLAKQRKHILSDKEEKLLAEGGEIFGSYSLIFTMIDDADMDAGEIKDENDELVKLTHAKFTYFLQSPSRYVRKRAFKQYYAAYAGRIHTLAQVYASSVKKDWYLSRVRKYKSSMENALKGEDIPVEVYDRLIKSVNRNLKYLHSYLRFRKKVMRVSGLHMYDLYVPLVKDAQLKLSFKEACDLVTEGLKPLGGEYVSLLRKAINERWIDVYESDGKRSGAYSMDVYGVHPYVLLNYEQTTHDVFTIAHELGHAMHSYYSAKTQPYFKSDYTIFVAEVASTVNEVLLLKHIAATTKDKNLKKYLLSYYLDMFRTTLFRQTLFSEFEAETHKMAEQNIPLNHENMSELYSDLIAKYYGKTVVADDEISYEWARIPHFYRSFYVYKYATGLTCAVSIAKMILEDNSKAKDYIKFLSAGGSDSPVELLKIAGVDLMLKKPYKDAMTEFADTLKELKSLY